MYGDFDVQGGLLLVYVPAINVALAQYKGRFKDTTPYYKHRNNIHNSKRNNILNIIRNNT